MAIKHVVTLGFLDDEFIATFGFGAGAAVEGESAGNEDVYLRAPGTAPAVLRRNAAGADSVHRASFTLQTTVVRRAPETSQVRLPRTPATDDNVFRRP